MNTNVFYFARRAFSDVLEGAVSTNLSGGNPSDPHFSIANQANRTIFANTLLIIDVEI